MSTDTKANPSLTPEQLMEHLRNLQPTNRIPWLLSALSEANERISVLEESQQATVESNFNNWKRARAAEKRIAKLEAQLAQREATVAANALRELGKKYRPYAQITLNGEHFDFDSWINARANEKEKK